MPTETQEKEFKKVRGNFPPLIVLDVAEKIQGVIEDISVTAEKDKKGNKLRDRVFYRLKLDKPGTYTVHSKGGEEESKAFKAEELVSIPNAGDLEYQLKKIAAAHTGEDEAALSSLKGITVIITRLPDDKMKSGKFKGNKVKVYDVEWHD